MYTGRNGLFVGYIPFLANLHPCLAKQFDIKSWQTNLRTILQIEIVLPEIRWKNWIWLLCNTESLHTVYFWREMLIKKHPFKCTSIWTSIIKRLWRGKKMFKVTLKLQRYFVIYIRSPLKMQKIIKRLWKVKKNGHGNAQIAKMFCDLPTANP